MRACGGIQYLFAEREAGPLVLFLEAIERGGPFLERKAVFFDDRMDGVSLLALHHLEVAIIVNVGNGIAEKSDPIVIQSAILRDAILNFLKQTREVLP